MRPPRSWPAPRRWPRQCRSTPRSRRSSATPRGARPSGSRSSRRIPIVGASTLSETNASPKVGARQAARSGVNPRNGPLDRVRVDSQRPRAHDQPGRAGRRQPEFAEGGPARARRCSRTSSSARRSRTSTTSAFPSASCTRAARPRTATSSATTPLTRAHARVALRRGRQAHAGVRALLHRGRRARLDRHRARRARLRGEVLHRRRQLGPGRQQHPGVLHPGRDEVSRPGPRGEARAAPRACRRRRSAHDTFWDFVSLMPESTHMLMWVMSDRAIPRSYRMMQGFGVHTFRFVNAARRIALRQVPLEAACAGTHSLAWDEAVKISGADPDFHRRDLWEAIEAGAYPGVGARRAGLHRRARPSASASTCSTRPRSSPRSWCRCMPVGRMVLEPQSRQLLRRDRAGGVLHGARRARASTSPTIRCSRAASTRTSTRRSRASAARTSTRSRSTRRSRRCTTTSATACIARRSPRPRRLRAELARRRLPVPGGRARASCRFPSRSRSDKVRGKPEKFAEHYNQATLFFNSQTRRSRSSTSSRAFRFELTKVQTVGDPRARGRDAAQRRRRTRRSGGRRASAWRCREPLPRVLAASAAARGRRRRPRCR